MHCKAEIEPYGFSGGQSTGCVDISVIVPCRNEAQHIGETIRRIVEQEGAGRKFVLELLLVDGQSEDGTRAIIEDAVLENPQIRLISNEKRITPVAFNLGIKNSKGRYICILGAHARIAENYLLSCLRIMDQTKADNVGGPWKAEGRGYVGKAITMAFQSRFSAGGAPSHNPERDGLVDTVWGGFYRRDVFERIGLFDEELIRNQDDELNYRLNRAGGKIWQSPMIRYSYICRDSLRKLFNQYFQYGYWKVRVIQKHRIPASVRHLVPGAFIGALIALGIFSLGFGWARAVLGAVLSLYALCNLCASVATCRKPGDLRYFPVMPLVFAAYHFGYGLGFLRGVIDFVLLRRGGRESLKQLTR